VPLENIAFSNLHKVSAGQPMLELICSTGFSYGLNGHFRPRPRKWLRLPSCSMKKQLGKLTQGLNLQSYSWQGCGLQIWVSIKEFQFKSAIVIGLFL